MYRYVMSFSPTIELINVANWPARLAVSFFHAFSKIALALW
jgi:hypothetical protein